MFTSKVKLIDGLPIVNMRPEEVTSVIVHSKSIDVSSSFKSETLPLTTEGVTNPFGDGDFSQFTELKQVKFDFPQANFTLEEWKQFVEDSYSNLPNGITFSLSTSKEVLSELSDNINFRNIKSLVESSLSKTTEVSLSKQVEDTEQKVEPSVGLKSEPFVEEETTINTQYEEDNEEDEYEEDNEEDEYEEDNEEDEYEEDEYEEDNEEDEYEEDNEEDEYEEDEYEEDNEEDEYEDDEYEEDDGDENCAEIPSSSSTVSNSNMASNSEHDEEVMAYAEQLTSNILETYNKIYPPCYIQRPYGILTTNGIITFDTNNKSIGVLKSGLNNFIISAYSKYVQVDGTVKQFNSMNLSQTISNKGLLYNYMPMLQAEIAYGVKRHADGTVEIVNKWGDYTDYLYNMLKNVIFNLLKTRKDAFDIAFQGQVADMFTNTVLLLEYDSSKAMHLVYKQTNSKLDLANYIVSNAQSLFTQVGEVISNPKPLNGFSRLLYAFNPKNYHSEILFAYKMYQQIIASGAIPSAKELIVGRALDGSDMRLDLENRQGIIGAIMAGPRSGKGVLTLSVLAGLMAHEKDNKTIPFIYCDGKPEMSATLWEIERTLNAQGVNAKILAIEGLNRSTDDGIGPTRGNRIVDGRSVWDFGRNMPEGVDISGVSVIPYLKMMQLFSAMAKASLPNLPSYTGRYARIMLILDETIAIKGVYNDFCSSVYTFLKSNKPRGKQEPSDEYLYVHRLANVLTHMEDSALLLNGQMTSKFVGTLVSEGPRKGFGVIQIGQYTTPAQWDGVQPKAWDKNPFGFLMKNATWRILGKNSGQSNEYGLADLKADGMSLIGKLEKGESTDEEKGQLGYFVYLNGATKDANLQKVFKSYLALNDNDYNPSESSLSGIFTSQLLSNASDEMSRKSIIQNDLLNDDGSIRQEVGFLGLAQMLMSDPTKLVERLTAGYNIVWEFMQANGLAERYECVEDYLVDCSPDSIFSVDELANGVDFNGEVSSGSMDYDESALDSSFVGNKQQATVSNDIDNIPVVKKSVKNTPLPQGNTSVENHFNSTVISTPNYTNTPQSNVTQSKTVDRKLTVRQLMGDKLFNMNKAYLDRIPCSISPQDSVRSKEIICHKPFQTVDVQRVEPLSEVLIPGFLNIEWITNKMCQSKRFSGFGRKLKQQGFYRKAVNKKETKTMLLSIGEAIGGLDVITHLDIVDRNIILNNMNFNYCGEITIDNFDTFQLTKLVNLKLISTDVPVSLMKVLSGLKCKSVDDLWEIFDYLDEVQCMGQTYKRGGGIADQTSLFQTEEEEKEAYSDSQAKYEELTKQDSHEEPTASFVGEQLTDALDDAINSLPSIEMPDSIKRAILMEVIDNLCEKKYSRKLPIVITELPNIDYFDNKEVMQCAVTCIVEYLNTLK